jgi:ABC-type multidrug transport system permease subunit
VLLAAALGVAFRASGPSTFVVGVQRGEGAARLAETLAASVELEAVVLDADEAARRLRLGRVALVVVPAVTPGGAETYWMDPTRPESRTAELLVHDALERAAGRFDLRKTARREMKERGSRYIDFLVPGLLGMNLMGTGMWGIGYSIVNARSKGLLKRLVATPMRRTDFLAAQIGGRLIFLVAEVGALLLFAGWVFDVPMRGTWGALVVVSVLGALTFGGLGLLVASRTRTIEGISGLMNFVMLPMWIGSGTFFATSRFPEAVQPWLDWLPLTAINDALRGVMLDGAPLAALGAELGIAGLWTVASFALALARFRWS